MSARLKTLIHVGCKELGLDAEARKDLQLSVVGKPSLNEMTGPELEAVLDRLKADGFKPRSKGRSKRGKAPRADLRLIHVLWRELGNAGHLERPDRDGLNAFIRAQFGASWGSVPADIDMLRDGPKINAVIEALKSWCRRAGIELKP